MTQRIPDDVRKRLDSIYVGDEDRYVGDEDRYVVALIVGYTVNDLRDNDPDAWVEMSSEEQAREAARWALDLTRDEGASTHWFVLDRSERVTWQFEQDEFDPEVAGFKVDV